MPLLEVGEKAPSFSMTNHDGANVSSGDFAGKYVLLWWYPRADTPG